MFKLFRKSAPFAVPIITALFTIVPEAFFEYYTLPLPFSNEINIVLTRFFVCMIIIVSSMLLYTLYSHFRKEVYIKGSNYNIVISYGNLFDSQNCKKVIPFDECFTTTVGQAPGDINPDSICGQFLAANSIQNMALLIADANLKPAKSKSKYQKQIRYNSGSIVPYNDYLLLAFAKLDENGLGRLSFDEYRDCLFLLWEELDKHYGQKDVCIPILGSGVTRINDVSPTQQELLEIILLSYKLSPHKLKPPQKLHIVCKKRDGFSLNNIVNVP